MRLTGGQEGRRTLVSPPGRDIRPTSDRVREALFSILGPLSGGDVLDIYAGAGTLGLEALSRGADKALFVDVSPAAIKAVTANIMRLGYAARAKTLLARSPAVIGKIVGQGGGFRWIFLDPPYFDESLVETLRALGDSALLTADGILVAEHDKATPLATVYGVMHQYDQRTYGRTVLSFYRHQSASMSASDEADEEGYSQNESRVAGHLSGII